MKKKTIMPYVAGIFLALLVAGTVGNVGASTLVPQTALPGQCIPQFQVPLPVFGPAGIARVDAVQHPQLTVTMKEVNQSVLTPFANMTSCGTVQNIKLGDTRVWAYEIADTTTKEVLGPANWPAVTVETRRFTPTKVTYKNELPQFNPANAAGPPYVDGLVHRGPRSDKVIRSVVIIHCE